MIIKNELGTQIYRSNNALIVITMLYKPVVGLLVFIEVTLMITSYQSSSVSSDILCCICFVVLTPEWLKSCPSASFSLDWWRADSQTRVKRNCLSYFPLYTLCFHLSEPTATPRKDSAMFACSLCVSNSQRQGWTWYFKQHISAFMYWVPGNFSK